MIKIYQTYVHFELFDQCRPRESLPQADKDDMDS